MPYIFGNYKHGMRTCYGKPLTTNSGNHVLRLYFGEKSTRFGYFPRYQATDLSSTSSHWIPHRESAHCRPIRYRGEKEIGTAQILSAGLRCRRTARYQRRFRDARGRWLPYRREYAALRQHQLATPHSSGGDGFVEILYILSMPSLALIIKSTLHVLIIYKISLSSTVLFNLTSVSWSY